MNTILLSPYRTRSIKTSLKNPIQYRNAHVQNNYRARGFHFLNYLRGCMPIFLSLFPPPFLWKINKIKLFCVPREYDNETCEKKY